MADHSSLGGSSPEPPGGSAPERHAAPGGVTLAANRLRFGPSRTRFEPETAVDWTFRIVDDGGGVVTDFEAAHGQHSHLIVVRRNLTRFQHLHPELESDGTWRVENLSFPDPGGIARSSTSSSMGARRRSGSTCSHRGVEARPGASRLATAGEYDIELLTDGIAARERTRLPFAVRRDGEPVPELGRYLGALGHLVALREGGPAYLHVHPEETPPDSGRVEFGARFPTPGRYRLFLQTKPEGNLITTQFDVRIHT